MQLCELGGLAWAPLTQHSPRRWCQGPGPDASTTMARGVTAAWLSPSVASAACRLVHIKQQGATESPTQTGATIPCMELLRRHHPGAWLRGYEHFQGSVFVPRTHTVTSSCLQVQCQRTQHLLLAFVCMRSTHGAHTYRHTPISISVNVS